MRPGVCLGVEALVAEVAGVHFADEGEVAVEVGVPGDGASGEGGHGGKGGAGGHECLSIRSAQSQEVSSDTHLEPTRGRRLRRGKADLLNGL